jgi:hypothetical protein
VLSQVQTRGFSGGSDEFVEIYNPGSVAVTFDSTWVLKSRSAVGTTCASNTTTSRFSGLGDVIPPHGHLLYANFNGYSGAIAPDELYTNGIVDAASLMLYHGTTLVDALCFYYDTTTETNLTTCSTPYVCMGMPAKNPHDNTTGTDVNASLERKPGGSGGNTQNTYDNVNDFAQNASPDPHDLTSKATP